LPDDFQKPWPLTPAVVLDVGKVVDRIVDIVNETLTIEPPGHRAGVLGSSIIQRRITELLDVPALIHEAPASASEPPATDEKGV